MRHHNSNRKFGRETNQRRALMRGLALSLIDKEQIQTTEAKAKELRGYVEKLITKAKDNSVATRRLLTGRLGGQPNAAKKLVETIAPRYQERAGGYTRVVKSDVRIGADGARMAIIEFV